MLTDFNWETENFQEEVLRRFNSLELNKTELKSTYTMNFINEKCDLDKNIEFLNEELSPDGYSIVEKVLELGDELESYETFISGLEELGKSDILNNLVDEEKYSLLVAISIWKNSAHFWLPTDMGGSGEGYELVTGSKKKALLAQKKL